MTLRLFTLDKTSSLVGGGGGGSSMKRSCPI